MTEIPFTEFPKIARLSREIVITEKIDGTNAQVYIYRADDGMVRSGVNGLRYNIMAGSRSRWITHEEDNHGFAKFVEKNKIELVDKLGEGSHFGEWWGSGIQRGYGLKGGEKHFSLFSTHRWSDPAVRPTCCDVVPELYKGVFDSGIINKCLVDLSVHGSYVANYDKPEGIVIYHTAAKTLFKKTLDKDDEWKGKNV